MFKKPEYNPIQNQNYLLLLSFFSVSLLMNYQRLVGDNNLFFCIAFAVGVLLFINFKTWWANIALLILNFILFAPQFPRMTNHSNLAIFVSVAISILLVIKLLRPSLKIPPNLVSYTFRVSLIAIYFYSGFHKLNADFFNADVSCANFINQYNYKTFFGTNWNVSPGISTFLQYGTIFMEMLLPFGLLWHKTRKFTAILLLCFHFYLSYNELASFSSFAAFIILGCLIDFSGQPLNKKNLYALKIYLGITLFTIGICPFLFFILKQSAIKIIYVSGYNLAYLIFFFMFFRNYAGQISTFKRNYFLLPGTCFLFISFWTLKTYAGLGNSANLTMYSNLMTEKSRSNHFLIDTKKTKLFNLEENNLLVLKVHPKLKIYKMEGYKYPLTEFHFLAAKYAANFPHEKLNITIIYKGKTIQIDDLAKSEFVKTKWWYKYVNFRKIQPEGPNQCIW